MKIITVLLIYCLFFSYNTFAGWNLINTFKENVRERHEITALTISPDGTKVACGTMAQTIKEFAFEEGLWKHITILNEPNQNLQPLIHNDWISSLDFLDNKKFISADWDQKIVLWQKKNVWNKRKTFLQENDYKGPIDLAHAGKKIVSSSHHKIKLWKIEKNNLTLKTEITKKNVSNAAHSRNLIIISPNTKTLAYHSGEKQITILKKNIFGSWKVKQVLKNHTKKISALAFSPAGNLMASGSYDKSIRIWKYENSKWSEIQRLEHHTDLIKTLSFSSYGTFLASGSYDMTIKIWKVDEQGTLSLAQVLDQDNGGHKDKVTQVIFSPIDDTLVSGCADGSIKFWQNSKAKIPWGHRKNSNTFNLL